MKLYQLGIVSIGLLIVGCGTQKNVSSTDKGISKADYPYIEQFHKAVRLKTVGDIDGAIAAFNGCIAMKSDDDAVYYALSQLYLAKGDFTSSSTSISKAQALDPDNIWYTQEMAFMFYENKNFVKSEAEFKKLVQYEPKNIEWAYGYADCLIRNGKTDEAIKSLNTIESLVGKNPGLSIEKYNLLMNAKKEPAALEELLKAREEFPQEPQILATLIDHYFSKGESEKAINMLEELVIASPENGRAHLALGDIYRQQRKKDEAYEQFNLAFKCIDVDIDTKMQLLINLQESSYKLDPQAIDLMELMVEQHPDQAKSYSIKGDFMLAQEKEMEALEAYKNALKYDKSQYPIWNQVLLMEYQNGDFESLYEDSKKCLEYFPTLPTVYLLNGVGAVQVKKYEDAISSLETGKELIVNDKVLEAEFYGQLGEASFGLENYAEGKQFYDKAIHLDPTSDLIKNNYAYRLALAKIDLDKALQLATDINKSSPGQPHFIDTKGWVLFQLDRFEDAINYFKQAVQLNNSDKVIVEHYGDALFKMGNIAEAITYWNKALELGSTNKRLVDKIQNKKYYAPEY